MFRYLVNLLLIISLIPGTTAFGLEVNGPLNNALMESSANDPVTNVIESRFYWNSTSKKPMIYNGTSWAEMGGGSGSGSGEKNYIENPSGAVNVDGWTCVGDLDIARTATASDLPREQTTATGLKITADANTQSTADYCYYDFTLDDIDLNRKLNVKWAQKQTGSYVASDLAVIVTTQADRTTAVATPLVTNIPAYDGEFDGNGFDTASTTTLSLVIRATTDMATDAGIVISDVVVGPGRIQAVPAVGNWTDMPSGSMKLYGSSNGLEFTNYQVNFARYRRDQDTMHGKLEIQFTGAPGTGTGAFTPAFVTGGSFTVDSTKVGTSGRQTIGVGRYQLAAGSGSANTFLEYSALYQGEFTTARASDSSSIGATSPAAFASGDKLFYEFSLPISEWAGAPNYAGQNDTYYYATSGTWDAASSTTTYGPQGATMSGALTAERTKTITTLTPIEVGDIIDLELKSTTNTGWVSIPIYGYGWQKQGTLEYGAYAIATGTNTILVVFEQYAYPSATATYASAGSAWTSTTMWRVRHSKAGAAVGFGLAGEEGRAGLVSREYTETYSTTWSDNGTGPGTSGSVSVVLQRIGNFVTAYIPAFGLTTGTGSPTSITSNTAMPTWARPTTAQRTFGGQAYANNATLDEVPQFIINTSGTIAIRRDPAGTSWGAGLANTGLEQPTAITWYAP